MNRLLLLAALPLFLSASPASSETPIGVADLRRHMEVLASDAYEGRAPGTAGGERTEAYLIQAFAEAGLKPGAANAMWRQVINMVERHPESTSSRWTANGSEKTLPSSELVLIGREAHVVVEDAPLLFAGYGTAEELAGADIKGAVLLVMQGAHSSGSRRLSLEELKTRGAAALVMIAPEQAQWADFSTSWLHRAEISAGPSILEGLISAATADAVIGRGDAALDKLREAAKADSFRAVPLPVRAHFDVRTKVRPFDTANIIGKVEGRGKADEAIVLLAHWDHLGICAAVGEADRICNGAADNASGTAIMIEVARRIAAGPQPERTIYFLGTTAEEMGLVGAHAFAASPPVPVDRIVAALNLDTTAIGPAGLPVAIIGRGEHPAIDKVVDDSARALGRTVDLDTEANIMIQRQDGWAFASRGIPTIMATGSVSDMKVLMDYLGGIYHKPSDDMAHATQLEGAAEDGTLHVAILRALADPKQYPGRTAP